VHLKNKILHIGLPEDNKLWENLKNGDEKAFSTLFKNYYNSLVQYGNTFSPFSEKIQDCVQDVFTDIWVYRNNLSDSVVVKSYLLSSVRKRIMRLHQKERIFNQLTPIDEVVFLFDFSIEHQLISDELTAGRVAHLNKLLNILPPRQKRALYLRYYHGLNVEQIAETFDMNYQSANNLLHRALVNIRKEWNRDLISA